MTGRIAFLLLFLFVFTLPWEKSVTVAGLGTAAKVAGGLTAVAGAAAAVAERRVRGLNVALFAAAAFVLWSSLTYFWSADPAATITRAVTLAQLLVMLGLVWNFCRTAAQQRALTGAYVAGACVASAATIFRYSQNLQTYYRRYAAPGFDPNDLGITVAIAMPLALHLAATAVSRMEAWLWRAAVLLCGAAVLLTASRTAAVAAAAAFLYVLFTWRRSTPLQRWSGVALAVALAAGAVALAPKASRQRIATITTEITQGTLHKRTTIWKAGFSVWKSNKLAGAGAGAYPAAVRPIIGVPGRAGHEYVAHNSFLSVLTETGLIGFVLFGGTLALLLIFVWAMPGRERVLWATVLLVWALGGSTLTWEHRKPTWLIFGLVMTEWARSFQRAEDA